MILQQERQRGFAKMIDFDFNFTHKVERMGENK
jgi:hypothetical protein